METFRTIINPQPSPNKIGYQTPVLFMGSCFTENIGIKMAELKFPVIVNPFGVMYNPVSVQKGMEILIDQKKFEKSDLGFYNDLWFSFYHDTEFSDIDQSKCLHKINLSIEDASKHLRKAKFLFIAFGTSWIYNYLQTETIVSNCHKIPAKEFERKRLDAADIFVEWANLLNRLNELNKELKIIFTVSPVRHWKDGAIENQLSKATLILAIHQLKAKFKNVEYFPAYEIMMDDLRDYRFYAEDMVHPSDMAVQYIWQKFTEMYFDRESQAYFQEVKQLNNDMNHRPFFPASEEFEAFTSNLNKRKATLIHKYPLLKNKLVIL